MESDRVPAVSVRYSDRPLAEALTFDQEEFLVPFESYALPPIQQLRWEFPGTDNVSGIFDGRPLIEHPARQGLSRKPGERAMLAKLFLREILSEEAIKEMFGFGWRPANQIGGYWFSRFRPDLQRSFWIIAPGAYAVGAGSNLVTVLSGGPDWRALGSRDAGTKWAFKPDSEDPQRSIAKKLFLFEKAA